MVRYYSNALIISGAYVGVAFGRLAEEIDVLAVDDHFRRRGVRVHG
jgi:hypothetical protein